MSMPAWDAREPGREPGSLLGGLFDVRRARQRDRQALALMLDRCGSETRYRRFHGHVSAFPERYLAGGPAHFALVAEAAGGGTLVALASCRTVAAGVAELGILVEDAWQRLGIGGRLLAEIVSHAERARLTTIRAQLLADQAWIAGMLRRHGTCAAVASRDVVDVTLRLGC
jgi:GNAT superfamily N-acetyltransferase